MCRVEGRLSHAVGTDVVGVGLGVGVGVGVGVGTREFGTREKEGERRGERDRERETEINSSRRDGMDGMREHPRAGFVKSCRPLDQIVPLPRLGACSIGMGLCPLSEIGQDLGKSVSRPVDCTGAVV